MNFMCLYKDALLQKMTERKCKKDTSHWKSCRVGTDSQDQEEMDINTRRIGKREGDKAKVNENIFVYHKN